MSELCDDNVEGQSERQSMSGSRRVWKPHVLPRKYLKQGTCTLLNKNGCLFVVLGLWFFETVFHSISSLLPERERKKRGMIGEIENIQTTSTSTYCKWVLFPSINYINP